MNQRELEDRGETAEQVLQNRVPELETQLAAEKARADKLEKELAHALDMGSQASVCAELAQTRADRLEKDLDERADADMANYALHAKLDAEKAARLKAEAEVRELRVERHVAQNKQAKAEAACAEMRDALEKARKFVPALNAGIGNYKATHKVIDHALSSDCGTARLSPEVAQRLVTALENIEDKCNEPPDCDKIPDIDEIAKEALALLDGKQ